MQPHVSCFIYLLSRVIRYGGQSKTTFVKMAAFTQLFTLKCIENDEPSMDGDRSYALLYVKDGIHVSTKEHSACSRINLKTNGLSHKV